MGVWQRTPQTRLQADGDDVLKAKTYPQGPDCKARMRPDRGASPGSFGKLFKQLSTDRSQRDGTSVDKDAAQADRALRACVCDGHYAGYG